MKRWYLLLMVLLFSCGFLSVFAVVQAQSKPTVPEFTVKIADRSYNELSTQSIDPYTGKTTTHPGYRVEKKIIEITIKNQNPSVMYSIRTKGHFEEQWRYKYKVDGGSGGPYDSDAGKYTVIDLGPISSYPDGAQIDFQVEALRGYFRKDITAIGSLDVFEGETSGWSKTQTITINKNNNEIAAQTPDNPEVSANPNQPTGFTWIQLCSIVAIVIVLSVTATFFILRKTNRTNSALAGQGSSFDEAIHSVYL